MRNYRAKLDHQFIANYMRLFGQHFIQQVVNIRALVIKKHSASHSIDSFFRSHHEIVSRVKRVYEQLGREQPKLTSLSQSPKPKEFNELISVVMIPNLCDRIQINTQRLKLLKMVKSQVQPDPEELKNMINFYFQLYKKPALNVGQNQSFNKRLAIKILISMKKMLSIHKQKVKHIHSYKINCQLKNLFKTACQKLKNQKNGEQFSGYGNWLDDRWFGPKFWNYFKNFNLGHYKYKLIFNRVTQLIALHPDRNVHETFFRIKDQYLKDYSQEICQYQVIWVLVGGNELWPSF